MKRWQHINLQTRTSDRNSHQHCKNQALLTISKSKIDATGLSTGKQHHSWQKAMIWEFFTSKSNDLWEFFTSQKSCYFVTADGFFISWLTDFWTFENIKYWYKNFQNIYIFKNIDKARHIITITVKKKNSKRICAKSKSQHIRTTQTWTLTRAKYVSHNFSPEALRQTDRH